MIRVLRVKQTGQWCGPAIIDGVMPDDPTYADRVAATLGLEPGSLEVVDAEKDPRTGELLSDPNIPQLPPEPLPDPQAELLKALATEWEAAATELRLGRSAVAADALDRAAAVARAATHG